MKQHKNRDWLYQKYVNEKLHMWEIAKLINVSRTAIWVWIDKFKIERPKPLHENKEWLYLKYIKEKLSSIEIGNLSNACGETILKWMEFYDIPRRSFKEINSGKNAPNWGKKGKLSPRWGTRHSEETKKKISTMLKGKIKGRKQSGAHIEKRIKTRRENHQVSTNWPIREEHHNWKGGISKLPYSFEFNNKLKEQIKNRDNFLCQKCGIHEGILKRGLYIHHVDYDKQNCDPSNLLSLCVSCNFKVNYKREYWTEYFQDLIMEV